MGHTLDQQTVDAFFDELEYLEKQARLNLLGGAVRAATKIPGAVKSQAKGFGGWVKDLHKNLREGTIETAQRAVTPIKSMRQGWKELAVSSKNMPRTLQAGGGGRVSETAKSLGRGGWTGEGRVTKYLPVGPKGILLPFVAGDVYATGQAAKRDPSAIGEGGVGETGLGALGGLAGMVAGGRRLLPSMLLWGLGSAAGSRTGRVLDRLRGGADLPTAVSAPSPQEAAQQLTNIQRYYG